MTNTREEQIARAMPAIESLKNYQQQLDADGCMVGVSRQALDETLAFVATILATEAAPSEPLDDKLVYIKPLRTLVRVQTMYADQVRDLCNAPAAPSEPVAWLERYWDEDGGKDYQVFLERAPRVRESTIEIIPLYAAAPLVQTPAQVSGTEEAEAHRVVTQAQTWHDSGLRQSLDGDYKSAVRSMAQAYFTMLNYVSSKYARPTPPQGDSGTKSE